MSDRPPIPIDIKRRVLLEAGHRCAIHTCLHPTVDLHHIISWEQCRKHTYDNLIALCPNCHRRADTGEIDRKSLRRYKARVSASFGLVGWGLASSQALDGLSKSQAAGPWRTDKIEETYEAYPAYEFEMEYPQFHGDDVDSTQMNMLIRADATRRLLDWRRFRLDDEPDGNDWQLRATAVSTFAASFEVSCYANSIVSIRYSVFDYGAGAAHPNHYTCVLNYQFQPLVRLDLRDLFFPDSTYLDTLSSYSIGSLSDQKGARGLETSGWTLTGVAPEAKNFEGFNVTRDGLLVTFDAYQVGCYAEGAYQVLVPKDILLPFIRPKCRVREFWQEPED